MLVRVLGGIEVRCSPERPLSHSQDWTRPPPQQRLVLALLASPPGRVRSADQLVQALWGDVVPANARRLLQGLVSRLRSSLEPPDRRGSRLRATPGGWRLEVGSDDIDAARFERLVTAARRRARSGRADIARGQLREAIGLWRGRAFGDLADRLPLRGQTAHLEEQLIAARELLLRLRLAAGEPVEVTPELRQLVVDHPLREDLWSVLLEALYRAGRQADALAAYQDLRQRLAADLGTEPSPRLQDLHQAILRQELPVASGDRPGGAADAQRWPCRRDLPLRGRDEELRAVRRLRHMVDAGQRHGVLVSGEPGIGKTRLAAELADAAATDGFEVLSGRCADGGEVAFQPFVEALPLAPSTERQRLFGAVTGWLQATSADRPLLLVLEDVHAAAGPTLRLLQHAFSTTAGSRLLLLVTYCDTGDALTTELVDLLARLLPHPHVSHLPLAPLDRPAATNVLESAVGGAMDRQRAARLHATTGGNPLLLQEIGASLQRRADQPAARRLAHDLPLPPSVHAFLEARLRRLPPGALRLVEHAAVIGDAFGFPVAADAAGLADGPAVEALDELLRTRLLAEADATAERYMFRQAVLRRALLARASASRRRRLHAAHAAALRRRRRARSRSPGSSAGPDRADPVTVSP